MTLIMIDDFDRYSIVLPRDGMWGSQDENGTWTGIVKDLQDKVGTISKLAKGV